MVKLCPGKLQFRFDPTWGGRGLVLFNCKLITLPQAGY